MVLVIVRETDEITPTSVMKHIVKVTTLAMYVTNNLRERGREREMTIGLREKLIN